MKRTITQNKSLHKYFEEVSRELNNHGVDVKVLVENLRVDSTPHLVKDIFRAIGKTKFGITSTSELTTIQVNECYDEFNRMLASVDISISFPSYTETEEYLKQLEQYEN